MPRMQVQAMQAEVSPDAPNKPEYVTLDFEKGNCIAVNGEAMSPLKVMQTLNRLGSKHGIGKWTWWKTGSLE